MPATTKSPPDRSAFVASLRDSGIVSDHKLDRVLNELPAEGTSAREVAEHLISGGALTRYQAERLLAGRADGFHIGPYVILEHLGKSATGRVFKARHKTMNRLVAIKLLAPELTATEAVREAIRAEARTAARLAHPNLVTLLDVNQIGERLYLVKDYLDGASVAAVLKSGGRFTIGQAADIARQAALGLQHAHEKQMAHGRLSPGAVLIGRPTSSGHPDRPPVKVSGFGLGRFAAESDAHATDHEYRAPEQFEQPELVTAAADVYSLGCVLYHMLAGQPPFPSATPQEAANGHRRASPLALNLLRPDAVPPLVSVVMGALAKDPIQRPTAEEVAQQVSLLGHPTAAGQIDLNLPAISYSPASSILASRSGLTPRPAAEPSPFESMTVGTVDPHERTPITTGNGKSGKASALRKKPTRAPVTRLNPLTIASVVLLVAFGVAVALVQLMKRVGVAGP